MSYDEYMMEHGSDNYVTPKRSDEAVGECAGCGKEIFPGECVFKSKYGEMGAPVLLLHESCVIDYLHDGGFADSAMIDEIADLLDFEKTIAEGC